MWRKSSYSGTANDDVCVELGRLAAGAHVGVRDSKNPEGGHLSLTPTEFATLITKLKQHPEPYT
ncbi:DUF397 domain-containing protein [Spirillospora sp. NBC_01491]|uniref:DUF397 domain-containing protein n=1 Tax=Spirillospora sp. NBC_01491 TaxID=2976007 RepID=UPI002E371866|nr:DUF397 domain-containing protein [Spirillospora sp. NBC_01491]